MVPVREGLQYIPRPGHLSHFEFPVVLGGEIDGEIVATDAKRGRDYDFSDIQVELVDTEDKVIKITAADPTGYFLFEQVIPADYQVRIAANSVGCLELVNEQGEFISVPKEDPIVSGFDIEIILPLELYDEAFGPYQPGAEPKPTPKKKASEAPKAAEPAEATETTGIIDTTDKVVEKKAEPTGNTESTERIVKHSALPKEEKHDHPELKTLENGEEYLAIPEKRYQQNIAAPFVSVITPVDSAETDETAETPVPVEIGIGGPTPEKSFDSFPSSTGNLDTQAETQTHILPWLLEDAAIIDIQPAR